MLKMPTNPHTIAKDVAVPIKQNTHVDVTSDWNVVCLHNILVRCVIIVPSINIV